MASGLTVYLGANTAGLKAGLAGAASAVAATAKKIAGIGLKAGVAGAAGAGAAAVAGLFKGVSLAADFEQTKVAFTTLVGDAGRAQKVLGDLRKLGAETPFEFPELADAGKKLIAFGEGSDTVASTLRRIGDISAGVGAPVSEIAELYGKARVQGRLFSEDINQLTGRGIPIIQELAKQFGVSDSEVKKLVESGQVGFPNIEAAFVSMTSQGGKFNGMMQAQSKTTTGLFSTLKDGFNEVLLTIGQPINDAIRPLIASAIEMVGKLMPMAQAAGQKIRDGIMFVIAAVKSGQLLNLVGSSLKLGFLIGVDFLWRALTAAFGSASTLLAEGVKLFATIFAENLKSAGVLVAEIFKNAVKIVSVMLTADFWKGLWNALQAVFFGLIASVQKMLANLIDWVKPVLEVLGLEEVGQRAAANLREAADVLAEVQSEKGAAAKDLLGPVMKDIGASMADSFSKVKGQISDSIANNLAAGKQTFDVVSGKFEQEMAAAKGIDTAAARAEFDGIVGEIRKSMPTPEPDKAPSGTALPQEQPVPPPAKPQDIKAKEQKRDLNPLLGSLAKIGGGGYAPSSVIDFQRENNRLTGRTNDLLREVRDRLKPGPAGQVQATFA
jgi:tape measure domain-containing protein